MTLHITHKCMFVTLLPACILLIMCDRVFKIYISISRDVMYINYNQSSINIIRTLKSPVLGVILYIQ